MIPLMAALLLLPFPQDPNYYQWCMENFADLAYCCQQAGGVLTVTGSCGDPVDSSPPAITITKQAPPAVIFPNI